MIKVNKKKIPDSKIKSILGFNVILCINWESVILAYIKYSSAKIGLVALRLILSWELRIL